MPNQAGDAHLPGNQRDTDRIEAFSDNIFAFAITLLIVNIHIPSRNGSAHPIHLLAVLLGLWPSFFAYLLSFVVIGIYWLNHHYVFKLYARTDHVFLLLNLLFLLFITFLPLPTFALSQYLTDPLNQKAAATMYSAALFMQALTWSLMWLYASRSGRIIDDHLDGTFVRRLTLQYLATVALYAVAVGLCTINVEAGILLCVGLTLLYLLRPPDPVYAP